MINVNLEKQSNRVLVSIDKADRRNKEAIKQGFINIGKSLVKVTENTILTEAKTGKIYRNPSTKEPYQSSSPGQTPALVTGDYFEGLDYKPSGARGVRFINYAPHAKYLEEGTPKMRKRPGMANAIKKNLKNNRMYLEESLKKALQI